MNALTSDFQPGMPLPLIDDAGPFSLYCAGETTAHDPDLGSWPVQTTCLLARFRTLEEAIACAERRGRPGSLRAELISGFTPNLLFVQDSRQRLCRAGQLTPAGLAWCEPVASDTEARQVVLDACERRGQAMAALDNDRPDEAHRLRFRAAAIEARLVDPVWRGAVAVAVPQAA